MASEGTLILEVFPTVYHQQEQEVKGKEAGSYETHHGLNEPSTSWLRISVRQRPSVKIDEMNLSEERAPAGGKLEKILHILSSR